MKFRILWNDSAGMGRFSDVTGKSMADAVMKLAVTEQDSCMEFVSGCEIYTRVGTIAEYAEAAFNAYVISVYHSPEAFTAWEVLAEDLRSGWIAAAETIIERAEALDDLPPRTVQ